MEDRINHAIFCYDREFKVKPKQMETLLRVLQGENVLVSLPVGYGKSLLFHVLPELLKTDKNCNPVVIVISPLNIIHKDQLSSLAKHGIPSCRLNIDTKLCEATEDGKIYDAQLNASLEDVLKGQYRIVLCHPEALFNTPVGRQLLDNEDFCKKVAAIVIDECHVIEKWGEEFRKAFKKLAGIKAFFPNSPIVALSGTLTVDQKKSIPRLLGLEKYALIEETPDKPNIFLEKYKRESGTDVMSEYEMVAHHICNELYEKKSEFPVTLLFLPVYYMSEILMYLNGIFTSSSNIDEAIYSAICSGQDEYVIDATIKELKKENPRIRLVLTTSIAGMGFDPNNVVRVIHACPPRNASQYLQEIGRAGRRGQKSSATLYFGSRDIASNLPGIKEDIIKYCKNESSCLRNSLLAVFGFEKADSIIDCECCSFCKCNCMCEKCVNIAV